MKKRDVKAFTLMELLAVLVILAIIALIVFPIIGDVITDSKMKAFKSSVDGLEHAVDLDYQKDYYTGVREYMYMDGNLTLLTVKEQQRNTNIKVEGIIENGIGFIYVDKDGNTSLAIHNEEWCAEKDYTDKTITIEEKNDDNCNVETPTYCFDVQETHLKSYDINLDNCVAYINENQYDLASSYDDEQIREACMKGNGSGSVLTGEGYTLEEQIEEGWLDIDELIAEKVIENVVYSDGLIITNYKCYEGNTYGYETITDVIIPSKINGKPIFKVGASAFIDRDLTNIIFSMDITSVAEYAFSDNQLTKIKIPNNVTTIGFGAFSNNNLTSITIPDSVQHIGYRAFSDNQLPDDQAFIYARNEDGSEDETILIGYGGAKRDNIIIPNGVITIGNRAFEGNDITSVSLGNSVQTIGEYAFSDNQLTSVTLGNSVQTFGFYSLHKSSYSNSNLTTIVNTTGRSFNWGYITGGSSMATFVTGTISHGAGDITVTSGT